ncbi:hypothetical protein LINPERPRIM_LOCUS30951 [Linum perenne]
MADFEPPSFSLDLDFDAEPQPEPCNPPPSPPSPPTCRPLWEEEDEETEQRLEVIDSEDEDKKACSRDDLTDTPLVPPSGRSKPAQILLKRLKRGGPVIEEPKTKLKTESGFLPSENANDDIKDFSSEDDDFVPDLLPSRHYNSVCSSSKVSLRGSGILTAQPSARSISKLKGKAFDSPASSSLETGHSGLVFPKLTASPLRRFRLNDSDEEPSPSGNANRKHEKVESQSTRQCTTATKQSGKSAGSNPKIEDLWKNFLPVQSVPIKTPALDAFCDEYFQSAKDKSSAGRRGDGIYASNNLEHHHHHHQDPTVMMELEQCWKVDDPLSPARHYFFHEDARIRSLVQNRLPHFYPVGVNKGRGNEQTSEPLVDYRNQFGGASKGGGTSANNMENGSTRGRKRPKKSDAKAASSQGWVDPKTTASAPKDAGRRRVQANDEAAAGHWFTSPEGRKVYVAKNGQELTGQTAYRRFKRASLTRHFFTLLCVPHIFKKKIQLLCAFSTGFWRIRKVEKENHQNEKEIMKLVMLAAAATFLIRSFLNICNLVVCCNVKFILQCSSNLKKCSIHDSFFYRQSLGGAGEADKLGSTQVTIASINQAQTL